MVSTACLDSFFPSIPLRPLGFPLSEHWILPTRRKSPSYCTPCLSTTLARCYTIPRTKTEPTRSWQLQNDESRSKIRCAMLSLQARCHRSDSTITIQWRFLDLNLLSPLMLTWAGLHWTGLIRSRRLLLVRRALLEEAWALPPTDFNGADRRE
jgi:hypothetical protein